jgi:mannose-6-phosphate isomerase-like protein (cupin superfamily)
MTALPEQLSQIKKEGSITKLAFASEIREKIVNNGYHIVEENVMKPWGGYFRIDSSEADAFAADFFQDLDPIQARLGNPAAEISPKIMLVSPSQRLSWQYHDRRAERWAFISEGAYCRSNTDDQSELQHANVSDVVQFQKSERHRLVAMPERWTLVAEIWQHIDPANPSNEEDITRLADDYSR